MLNISLEYILDFILAENEKIIKIKTCRDVYQNLCQSDGHYYIQPNLDTRFWVHCFMPVNIANWDSRGKNFVRCYKQNLQIP